MNIPKFLLVKVAIVLAVAVGAYVIHGHVVHMRRELAKQQQALDETPRELLNKTSLARNLRDRSFDITRIHEYVVSRDDIVSVVSAIEEEGEQDDLVVRVPDITEILVVNEKGEQVLPEGPVQDIRLRVNAFGDPDTLLSFLYRVEHLPYLMHAEEWSITTDRQQIPTGRLLVSEGDDSSTARPSAYMQADVIVTVEKSSNAEDDENSTQ